jgi:hypothetical protein
VIDASLPTAAATFIDWRLVKMLVFVALVPLLVRKDLRRLERLLEPRGAQPRGAQPFIEAGTVERLVAQSRIALRIASPIAGEACLVRGLVLYRFLRGAGVDVTLAFGVGEVAGATAGHCWLELNGSPFLEGSDPRQRFTRMYSFPSTAGFDRA